jgi:hypothetical protein
LLLLLLLLLFLLLLLLLLACRDQHWAQLQVLCAAAILGHALAHTGIQVKGSHCGRVKQ